MFHTAIERGLISIHSTDTGDNAMITRPRALGLPRTVAARQAPAGDMETADAPRAGGGLNP